MSSITFPHPQSAPLPSSHQEDLYYSQSGFAEGSSSFQMNPLSQHPPRTPRTSIISNGSTAYKPSTYEAPAEKAEAVQDDDEELDEEEERVKAAERKVVPEEVWKDMILTSNGRDKAFKLIQYSIRVYLLFHAAISSNRVLKRPAFALQWQLNLTKRLSDTASGLSFTRKCLLLFNWLHPLSAIRAQQVESFSSGALRGKAPPPKSFIHAALYAPPPVLLELMNAVADDLSTLANMGLLGKRLGDRAGKFSDWCWFLSTLVGLVENGVEREMITSLQGEVEGRMFNESMANGASAKSKPAVSKLDERELSRLSRQDYWLQVTRAKLLMDLIFVSYEVFGLKRGRNSVKTLAGLASAILSSAKLYDKHKASVVKSILAAS